MVLPSASACSGCLLPGAEGLPAPADLYKNDLNPDVRLPEKAKKYKELIQPEIIIDLIKDTDIELPVLLAMWLSFSISEIKGLTKSKCISCDYMTNVEVEVRLNDGPVKKENAKNHYRTRRHRIPPYVKELIDRVKVDNIIDDYFYSILNPEEKTPLKELPEEIRNILESNVSDELYEALMEYMQHEMQHKAKKVP